MQERLEKVFRLAFGLMVLCMHPLQAAHDLGKPLLLLLRWKHYRNRAGLVFRYVFHRTTCTLVSAESGG